MLLDNSDDFVDRVAQAVIDRIEQRDQVAYLVEMVTARVLALQREEAELQTREHELADEEPISGFVTDKDEEETTGKTKIVP